MLLLIIDVQQMIVVVCSVLVQNVFIDMIMVLGVDVVVVFVIVVVEVEGCIGEIMVGMFDLLLNVLCVILDGNIVFVID